MIDEAYLNVIWSGLVVEELIRHGVTSMCMSPGSRCTPLVVTAAHQPDMDLKVHFDERGAAFYALGLTRVDQRPAAVLSTSGTAVVNFMPAIVEAAMDGQPLIVLTADRPPELQQTGANQTIDQAKIFGNYVRWHFDVPCPTHSIPLRTVLSIIDQGVYRSMMFPPGPVHINIAFREPFWPDSPDGNRPPPRFRSDSYELFIRQLTGFLEAADDKKPTSSEKNNTIDNAAVRSMFEPLRSWVTAARPLTVYELPTYHFSEIPIRAVRSALHGNTNGLLIIGKLKTDGDRQAALELVNDLNWPVFPDITSGVRLGSGAPANTIHYYDQMLSSEKLRTYLRPETILHLGGEVTSRRLLEFLHSLRPNQYIQVSPYHRRPDPGRIVTSHIIADIREFVLMVKGSSGTTKNHSLTLSFLRKISGKIERLLDEFGGHGPEFNEPTIAWVISQHIPPGTGLFLASSMPIRDFDMFANHSGASVRIGVNRGASGIDGTVATAAGFARRLKQPLTLVIGDLAMLHDFNSLALVASLPEPIAIVVINNDGGGIFSFLPVAKLDDVFEQFFATPHGRSFDDAARMFGLSYRQPADRDAFIEAYRGVFRNHEKCLIEVKTSRSENHDIHQHIAGDIIQIVDKCLAEG